MMSRGRNRNRSREEEHSRRRCIRMKTMEINEMTQTLLAHILQRRHHRRGSAQWNSGNAPSAPFFFFLRLIEEFYMRTAAGSRSQLRAAVSNTTKSPLQLCSGHSLAMCFAVWSVAPHSHDADGDISTDSNLP